MEKTTKKASEPLFHIVKRGALPFWQSVLYRVIAILLSLVVCSVFVYLAGHVDPAGFFSTMIDGVFGNSSLLWTFLYYTALLLCISLAVTPAFKMRFWNCGAEGQVLMSGLATTACMVYLGGKVPMPVLYLIMCVAGITFGIIWAIIPALCKAKWNTNETLFTLMMNYVAMQIVSCFIDIWVPGGSHKMSDMPEFGFPTVVNEWFLNILIVVILTIGLYVYLRYSKHGYEISVVGESENTAKYVGINVKKVIIRTMMVSGALCGVAGLIIAGGMNHCISTGSVLNFGFTAILVSWLSKFNPFVMVLTSAMVLFFKRGGLQVRTVYHLSDVSDIVTAIILFFIIGCEFFINYKIMFRQKSREVAK